MPFFRKIWNSVFGSSTSEKTNAKEFGKTLSGMSEDSNSFDSEPAKAVKSLLGLKTELKHLYRGADKQWTDKYPKKVRPPPENDETAQFALLVRHQKSNDSHKKLELHSIVVQSPYIKRVLGTVLANYHGVTTTLDRLEFNAPFEPFFHRWERLRTAMLAERDETTKSHLVLLWEVLEEDMKAKLARSKNLTARGVMEWDLLWTIFEPGILVYVNTNYEKIRKLQTYSTDYCDLNFDITLAYVDWNGKNFGIADEQIDIVHFNGTRKITDLSTYPLAYHQDLIGVQKRCIARGHIFESYKGFHFKAYRKSEEPSRIIIDTAAWNEHQGQVQLEELIDDPTYKAPNPDVEPTEKGVLSNYQLLIAYTYLRGFKLKEKKWDYFQIDLVEDIAWNDRAFPSLVLPGDTKDLILAFAQSQLKRTQKFDDVIEGKGKGTVMLLSGPPGVGKTLTAEAIAEHMRVPLYSMSAAELGLDPSAVDTKLNKIFAMTTKWKAVLLLDEADVFLEARSTHDLERNKLVSIFLRVLEYYEGFLFLTSNRVEDIDAAFESRIHLSLQYEHLSVDARVQVWKTFLTTVDSSFSEEQLNSLAQIQLNGRQIKNIVKTSQLLASSKDAPLSFKDVEVVTRLRAANVFLPAKGN